MAIDRNKVIATAQKYIQKGSYRKAIREYQILVKDQPDDVRILLKIGDLQARDGQPLEAAATYSEVADYYVAQGFFLKAVAVYKQLLRLVPDDIDVKLRLADLYAQLSLMSDAVQLYDQVATHFQQHGLGARFREVLNRMIALDPTDVGPRIRLAEQFSRDNMPDAAAEQFGLACDILFDSNRLEDYVKVAERLIHHAPDDVDRLRQLARVYLDLNDPRRALLKIQHVFRREIYDLETVDVLTGALERLGESARAVAVLSELAGTFATEGRTAERDAVCERILTLDPTNEDALRALGRLRQAPPPRPIAQPEGATIGRVAVASVPQAPAVEAQASAEAGIDQLLSETDIYLKYNLFDRALDHLRKVFAIDPNHVGAMERKKQVHIANGQTHLAVRELLRLATALRVSDPAAAERAVDEASLLAPDDGEVMGFRAALMASRPAPASRIAEPPRIPRPAASAVPVAASQPSFDEFNALFGDFAAENTGSRGTVPLAEGTALTETHFAHEAPPVVEEPEVPDELQSQLDEVGFLAEQGLADEARGMLLELVGDWPEHAELLLRRMDQLPVAGAYDVASEGGAPDPYAFDDEDPSAVTFVPSGAYEAAAPVDDDTASLFLDEDEPSAPQPAVTAVAAPPPRAAAPSPWVPPQASFGAPVVAGPSAPLRTPEPVRAIAEPVARTSVAAPPAPTGFPPPQGGFGSSVPAIPRPTAAGPLNTPRPVPAIPIATPPSPSPVSAPAADDVDDDAFSIDVQDTRPPAGQVDAPVGRASSVVRAMFSESTRVLAEDPDCALAEAIRERRDGNAMAALMTLESWEGPWQTSATFERAICNVELGMYFDAVQDLEGILQAPGLTPDDLDLIHYYCGVAYEAFDQPGDARASFERVRNTLRFPDVSQRLSRL